jgi:DNA-binding CsgD family transcriptional regulator
MVEMEAVVFETRYAPLRDEQDTVVGLIGVAVDVTERRRLQGELEALRCHHAQMSTLPLSTDNPAVHLTCREWDVIQLIAAGKTNREIGLALSISIKTVEKHVSSVHTKLGLTSRAEVTTWALHHPALIPPERRQG